MQEAVANALETLGNNKEWVFSGIGVAIISALIALVVKMFRRPSTAERLAQIEIERRQIESFPMFRWGGGSTDHTSRTCQFENLGGTASQLGVRTASPLAASINPSDRLPTNGRGFVRFVSANGRIVYPFEFEVRYSTALGATKAETFRLEAVDREPVKAA